MERAKRRREEANAEQARVVSVEVADIAAASKRAKESGQVEKTAGESGVAGSLRNKFVKWLESVHGKGVQKRLEDEGGAPTIDDAKQFSTWVHTTRQSYSCVDRKGCGDSVGNLQLPYMLAKFVFPMMKYEGWVGLSLHEAKIKNQEYCHELSAHWKALNVSQPDVSVEGVSLHKKKWDDSVYFMAQDLCMADEARPNRAMYRLAVMGFVRTTCVRAGSIAKDWFDRSGRAARWIGVNVLSVSDYEWDRERKKESVFTYHASIE